MLARLRALLRRWFGPRRSFHAPRRALVVGAGSFGTGVAVLLARGGLRTDLACRTEEQAQVLRQAGRNEHYLPDVELPTGLSVTSMAAVDPSRADLVFLAVPSDAFAEALEAVRRWELPPSAGIVSLTKGLIPPEGIAPTAALEGAFGPERVACVGGPAHAMEMVQYGAGLVAASRSEELTAALDRAFTAAGVVCEPSADPVGVELAGVTKNAAALAAGATESQGPNAAGMAAGHIFGEVWRYAEQLGTDPATFVGLAGIGDLVATALAPRSRNRRAGELLSQGVPATDIPAQIGQAVESFDTVPLLAASMRRAGVSAPTTDALARLIAGALPLKEWVKLVRTTVPQRRLIPRRARRRRA